ncbi:MAG: DNA modification methylase, partial [Sphingobacteriales bacterium]
RTILAGHGRVKAAELLGLAEVPTVRLSHLGEAAKRAYVIADNRLAEKAGWDREAPKCSRMTTSGAILSMS